MKANQLTKKCNHATNGSFHAFAEGFRAVTGREPEEYIDYWDCCWILYGLSEEVLTDEQLTKCRGIGHQFGRQALKDQHKWKTVKLHMTEVEELVRSHTLARIDLWHENHDLAYGGCTSGSTWRGSDWAIARMDYLYATTGIKAQRMEEIEREVWRKKIGEFVKKCDCDRCLKTRRWLFPDLAQEWKQVAGEPEWQGFTAEVRRQYACVSDDDLSLLTQRAIQSNASPVPADEAVRRAVREHARWRYDCEIQCGEEEAMRVAMSGIDELLAKWRGEVGAETEGKHTIDHPQVQPYSLF